MKTITKRSDIFFIIQLQSYYFARDDIANHGFAKFFKKSSDEERDHAQMFMEYQVSIDGVKVTSLGVSKTFNLKLVGTTSTLEFHQVHIFGLYRTRGEAELYCMT